MVVEDLATKHERELNRTTEVLNVLGTFHYVLGGIIALFALIPIIHFAVGFFLVLANSEGMIDGPPPFIGFFFMIMGAVFIIGGEAVAICVLIAGSKLRKRQSYLYCLIVAGILCAFTPLGTILGIFTLINLTKPEAKELFSRGE